MDLPPKQIELVERTWAELKADPHQVDLALVSKGPVCDNYADLSDIDLRLILDSRAPKDWRWADDACFRAFKRFTYDFPDDWRIVEHTPGNGIAVEELHRAAVRKERLDWEVLREDTPGMIPPSPPLDADVQKMSLGKFWCYRAPYSPALDPPVNIAPQHLDRYPLFSICWHYYAPALRCAAQAMGVQEVRTKFDALHWRIETGSAVAALVEQSAEADFFGPVDDLAVLCSDDVQKVAHELTGTDDPWTTIEEQLPSARPSEEERLCAVIFATRTVTSRWRLYTEAPDGYDVAAVLRIDRGHIFTYLIGPVQDDIAAKKLRDYAPDPTAHDAGIDFLLAEHHSTDFANPRETFARLHEHCCVVREAMERWYADVS